MIDKFLVFEGNTNDLLIDSVDKESSIKSTRLVRIEQLGNPSEEIMDVAITSSNIFGNHPLFDRMINKKIRITIDIIE